MKWTNVDELNKLDCVADNIHSLYIQHCYVLSKIYIATVTFLSLFFSSLWKCILFIFLGHKSFFFKFLLLLFFISSNEFQMVPIIQARDREGIVCGVNLLLRLMNSIKGQKSQWMLENRRNCNQTPFLFLCFIISAVISNDGILLFPVN